MKRDATDAAFSDCIRERVNWTCERCGKYYPEGQRRGLDCSHFYGRRHHSTRWHPDNAFAHCRGCHQYLGSNPAIFAKWVLDQLGDTRYDWLMQRHNQIAKYSKKEKKEIAQHYKQELKRIQELRKNGETGYIELISYD